MRSMQMLVVDVFLVALSAALALELRENLSASALSFSALLPFLGISVTVSVPVLLMLGLNRGIWRLSAMSDYIRVVVAAIIIVALSTALTFLVNRLDGVARAFPILQGMVMVMLMVGARVFIRLRHASRGSRPGHLASQPVAPDAHETIVLLGINRIAELFLQAVDEFASDRVTVAGLIGHADRHVGRLVQQRPILGTPSDLAEVIRDLEVKGVFVNRIVVTTALSELPEAVREALLDLERSSSIKIDPFADRIQFGGPADGGPGSAAWHVQGSRTGGDVMTFAFPEDELNALAAKPYWGVKRVVDVVIASLLIVVALPLIVPLALLVLFDVGAPLMFWQQRPGLGGRPFRLYKLRTMVAAHTASGERVRDEDRVSSVGRLLRRTRWDELPQLFNILKGDMSFVGPRPLLPVDQPAAFAARLMVRPGLTGWAQVAGGRDVSASDKAALDVWYVRNASLVLDLKILVKTVPMVVFGERVDGSSIRRAWKELREAGICARGGSELREARIQANQT